MWMLQHGSYDFWIVNLMYLADINRIDISYIVMKLVYDIMKSHHNALRALEYLSAHTKYIHLQESEVNSA